MALHHKEPLQIIIVIGYRRHELLEDVEQHFVAAGTSFANHWLLDYCSCIIFLLAVADSIVPDSIGGQPLTLSEIELDTHACIH